ncbi:MAG: VRR-NUC domain-containing protein [Clostridia bacterium]|nr:VRR-NUC domain-containing protein [Clostridia bacterium]
MEKKIENLVKHAEVSEKAIERYLADRVKELGGICLKYSNPGMVGYPDRICLLPGGVTIWVELKSKGGELKAVQKIRITQLRKIGHTIHVCSSKEAIDEVLEPYKKAAL